MHTCQAPTCTRWIPRHYFACAQHRSLLGWTLSARVHSAWLERSWAPEKFEEMKAKAFNAWAWQQETTT
jgi:hypothetical protein